MASARSASRVDDAMTAVCLLVRRRPRLSACQPWRLPLFAGLTSVHTRLRRLGLSAAIDCFARRSYAAQPLTLSNHAQALAVLQRQGRQSTSSCSDCSLTTCSRRDASGGLGKPRAFRLASVFTAASCDFVSAQTKSKLCYIARLLSLVTRERTFCIRAGSSRALRCCSAPCGEHTAWPA